MALEQYRAKRNFSATPEPRPKVAPKAARGDSFVVQKHDARRLHYDFRLELDGVLKSWAVTRGPSLVAGEKRLAVEVEDHPLDYGSFEGTIPKGEYGGGSVLVWDRGTWTPIGDPHKGLAKGHLEFELHGQKLNGRWHLVRMQKKPRDKHENWLLIKGEDEYARPEGAPDILEERPESAATGRPIDEVAKEAPGWSSKTGRIKAPDKVQKPRRGAKPARAASPVDPASIESAKKASMPGFVEPMLASLAKSPPSGERWLHEIKFDGYRLEVHLTGGRVRLMTRSGLDWTAKFGDAIVAAFKALPVRDALIDGELVVENAAGASDFSALQADLSEGRTDRFLFYAFDLLYLDGYDLREARARRAHGGAGEAGRPGFGRASAKRPFRRGRRDRAAARLPPRARGNRLEATRRSLSFRARKGLDQIEMLGPAGVRGGGLRSLDRRVRRGRLAGRSASTRATRCAMSGGSARASARRPRGRSTGGSSRCASPRARSPTGSAQRRRARFVSCGPSSWRRSTFAPGPPTTSCATPRLSGCARTRRRARLCARRLPRRRRQVAQAAQVAQSAGEVAQNPGEAPKPHGRVDPS